MTKVARSQAKDINQRQARHGGRAALITSLGATLAIMASFLAPTISPASAAVTTAPTTTTTTTTTAPTTTTTAAVAGSNCLAPASGTVLDRTGWVASSNAPSSAADAPARALDSNYTTRFSTNKLQSPGLYFQVDLGSSQSFYLLKLSAPNSPSDYARGYHVATSNNGTSWATVARCTGTVNPELVGFDLQSARYIRVTLTAGSTSQWWSIDELNLYGKAPVPTTTTTVTTTTRPGRVVFPGAGTSYPDGALLQTRSGSRYLFAGGKALPIVSGKEWALVRRLDRSVVVYGPVSHSQVVARMRPGTVVQVAGKGAYWVAGTDGRMRAFTNHAQYLADGYDPAQLLEVGGLTGLSFARGAPASAPALRADGALAVAPNHVVYVMAGGRAFRIASRAELVAIVRLDHARLVKSPVPAWWQAVLPVRGTLFRVFGGNIFVSYGGALYGPAGAALLSRDGYRAARALPVPTIAGLEVHHTY